VNGRYLYSNKIYAENVWELKGPPGERQKEQFLFLVTIPALPSITPPWRGAQLKKSAGTTLSEPLPLYRLKDFDNRVLTKTVELQTERK
jgi:hypothetical protein